MHFEGILGERSAILNQPHFHAQGFIPLMLLSLNLKVRPEAIKNILPSILAPEVFQGEFLEMICLFFLGSAPV